MEGRSIALTCAPEMLQPLEHLEDVMTIPFFAMANVHASVAGDPPIFRNENSAKYYGYFENFYGEQWVFLYDRDTKTAELRGGDAGWQHVYPVQEGRAQGVMLNRDETQWLALCWRAAKGER